MCKKFMLIVLALGCLAGNALAKDVVFAVDATYPPMEMIDGNKNIVGFCPELVMAIGKAAGFTPVLKNTAWDGIFAGLSSGKYDAIASSVSITPERKQTMDFTDPYFEVQQGVVVPKGVAVNALTDLSGKKVASQMGTTGYFLCKKIEGAQAKPYDEIGLAMEDLYNGRVDAVIADAPVASDYALQNEQYSKKLTLAFMVPSETPEYLGFAVNKGNTEIAELINKGLAGIKANGEYDVIYNKWFGTKK
ncbi:MAG: basic amino acid ABC transporter substrate-binding protein [Deltaproteobacteria bacterium]|nr:basic amino acid ABC transporter substrate-binding protein [Deltaproteobacteria bacterium]